MLHIGSGRMVRRQDIIAIIPERADAGAKARVLMADGRVLRTAIAPATLLRRLQRSGLRAL